MYNRKRNPHVVRRFATDLENSPTSSRETNRLLGWECSTGRMKEYN
jgi:hypothetical protein